MFTLSDSIRYRKEDFGGIVFRKEDNFFIQINDDAYKLIDLFNNSQDISEILNDYPDFFNYLKELNIIKQTNSIEKISKNKNFTYKNSKFNKDRLINAHLRSPLEMAIEITSKCQLKCIHCYGAFDNNIKKNELSDSEIKNLIDDARDMGVFAFFIGGGEPTIHPSFFDICQYSLNKDINVVISTNAVNLDKNITDKFKKLNSYFGIQVSIEGSNSIINDSIRGKGAYEKSLRGLKNLQKTGFNPTLGVTVMNKNYKDIENIIGFAINNKISHIHFMSIMPSGRADELYENLKLSYDERLWLSNKFIDLKNKYTNLIGIGCDNFFQQPPSKDFDSEKTYDYVDKIYSGCEASRVRATVTSQGDVIGCEILRDYVAGNIREKNIKDIWENSIIFKKIRSRNSKTIIGKCNTCKYIDACVGDCPAYSLHNKKSFFVGGTECPHEPEKNNYKIIN